jgi:hypothetical protein
MRAVALALLVAATPAFADVIVPSPTVRARPPSGRVVDGVILSVDRAHACFGMDDASFTPAAGDVKKLEALLPKAIAAIAAEGKPSFRTGMAKHLLAHLASDKRFYLGVEPGGARYIVVKGFCADLAKGADCPPLVKDGGDCIWRIRYDVKRGTFDQFETNGVA